MSALFHVMRPPSTPRAKAPLLVLLHGYGSNESDLIGLSPYLDERLMMVSARAPIPMGNGGNAWFPIDVGPEGISLQFEQAGESVGLIGELVRGLQREHEPERTILLGFSQGGMMALSTAFSHPGLCDGVAALSCVVVEPMLPAEDVRLDGLPVIMTHGTEDAIIPLAQGRASRQLLQRLPLALDYREYEMGHEINQASLGDVDSWLTARIDAGD